MFDVNGKVCVVTGGAQGLGKEFALKLLNNGGRVCITDINETQGLETVQDLTDNLGHSPKNVTFCRQVPLLFFRVAIKMVIESWVFIIHHAIKETD